MRLRIAIPAVLSLLMMLCGFSALLAFQARFKEYAGEEDNPTAVPKDAFEQTEWTFARLRYPSGRYTGYDGERGSWPTDFPKADRQFLQGVRRLTRIHTRSTEQVIDLIGDPDEVYNWPWVYAVEVGHWDLTDEQCKLLREYFLRGGFLMVDDFWGPGAEQWNLFRQTMQRVFPGRPITDIAPGDSVMHVLYDIEEKDRTFIPGSRHLRIGPGGGVVVQQPPGTTPAWRAIADDRNRMIVAVNYNTDIGDAWEYADSPEYPERMTALAYRYGINYVIYAMTH